MSRWRFRNSSLPRSLFRTLAPVAGPFRQDPSCFFAGHRRHQQRHGSAGDRPRTKARITVPAAAPSSLDICSPYTLPAPRKC